MNQNLQRALVQAVEKKRMQWSGDKGRTVGTFRAESGYEHVCVCSAWARASVCA